MLHSGSEGQHLYAGDLVLVYDAVLMGTIGSDNWNFVANVIGLE